MFLSLRINKEASHEISYLCRRNRLIVTERMRGQSELTLASGGGSPAFSRRWMKVGARSNWLMSYICNVVELGYIRSRRGILESDDILAKDRVNTCSKLPGRTPGK